ncbi:MAG TPA: hypothetical protein DCW41_08030 [Clostridiales bacterium]|nr:hypothetical protein [Clostridiales bacterium]
MTGAARSVVRMMRFDGVFWIILASLQIIFGIPLILFFGYGIAMIGCGIWNIYAATRTLKNAGIFSQYPSMIFPFWRDSLNSILISMGINLVLGGAIGVLAGVYDLLVRDYVVKHESELKASV